MDTALGGKWISDGPYVFAVFGEDAQLHLSELLVRVGDSSPLLGLVGRAWLVCELLEEHVVLRGHPGGLLRWGNLAWCHLARRHLRIPLVSLLPR